jgi:catechol 2,3-dioxygenase-like lactoylglutathione lyase family enzyme
VAILNPGPGGVHHGPRRYSGVLDHLWIGVRNLDDSTRFYETGAPTVGHQTTRHPHRSATVPERTRIHGDGATFSLVEGEPTTNLHLAFAAPDQATVRSFHQAGIDAGYQSLGEPGERPQPSAKNRSEVEEGLAGEPGVPPR